MSDYRPRGLSPHVISIIPISARRAHSVRISRADISGLVILISAHFWFYFKGVRISQVQKKGRVRISCAFFLGPQRGFWAPLARTVCGYRADIGPRLCSAQAVVPTPDVVFYGSTPNARMAMSWVTPYSCITR